MGKRDMEMHKQHSKRRRSGRKTRFKGNQFTKQNVEQIASPEGSQQNNEVDGEQQQQQQHEEDEATPSTPPSASSSKIDLSFYDGINSNNNNNNNNVSGSQDAGSVPAESSKNTPPMDINCLYLMADLKILLSLFDMIGTCPECGSGIDVTVDFPNKMGLAQRIILRCDGDDADCSWEYSTYLSERVKVGEHKRFDINIRSIAAFREIGRGKTHIDTFHRVMNMCPPFSHSNYDEMVKDMSIGYIEAMNDSIEAAASNVKNESKTNEVDETVSNVDENGLVDCDVSLDGAWQRRGYASLNGFVSAIERVTDKVIDVEIMTKTCRACTNWNGRKNDPGYIIWRANHNCPINHEGSSSSMESEGAVKIFMRSIEKFNVRYVNYIGDGDSSAFAKVIESNPYPDITVNKLECIGHIQKRVGSNLIKLTQQNSSIKGRGDGRLTKKVINTLQNYYGMAIRSARSTNIMQMKMSIAAVLCHCVRKVDEHGVEDLVDRHKYCTKDADTWCKYQKSLIDGTVFQGDRINIAEDVYDLVRPVWLRLSENALLEKCLHGRTQNVNEAFNALVWQRCPKTIFVGKTIFNISVASAVVDFNDGRSGILKILLKLGLRIGHFNQQSSLQSDLQRITYSNYKSSVLVKKQRKLRHAIKKGYTSNKDYGAGMF